VAGFKSSFLPFHIKQSYLRQLTQDLPRFCEDGQITPPSPPSSGRPETHRGRPLTAQKQLS
jgi:adenosine deaminase